MSLALKNKRIPFADSSFKSSKNNDVSNTPKLVKPLFEQKLNKNKLSHSKTVENIETKDFEMFSTTKFREQIESFIDRLVGGQESRISECEKDLDAKTVFKLDSNLDTCQKYLCIVLTETLVIGQNLLNAFI